MRKLLLLIIFLIASIYLGLVFAHHPGYLFIVYEPWSVQMPIWFAALATVFCFLLFYFLIDSINQIKLYWFRLKNWLHLRREHEHYSKTQQGLSALIEGRYKKAEELLLQGIQQSVDPIINYLATAKAAHEQGAFDRRDAYIKKAYTIAPKAQLAIGITQAELELEQDQLEHAIGTLTHLQDMYPRHPRVLKLLEKAYVRSSRFEQLKNLLPSLYKAKVVSKEEYVVFEKNIYVELLNHASMMSLVAVKNTWGNIPSKIQKHSDVVYAYLHNVETHQHEWLPEEKFAFQREAEKLIRKQLKTHWHDGLAEIYSTLHFTDLNRQLVIAGAWLKQYGEKPILCLMLAHFCMQLKLWGRAKDYFEKALAGDKRVDAAIAYGELLEKLGESKEAMLVYKEALI